MKSIIVTPGKKDSIRLTDLPEPELDDNEILIKTLLVGIDSTDKEINNAEYGEAPKEDDYLILGHEALGKIAKLGENIKNEHSNLKIGDYVVPLVRKPDDCHYCQNG
ncbi:MAG: glucose dehydrogenase, partial [Promethearchaeota archaeon]